MIYTAPSSIGQDNGFSSRKGEFDSRWGHGELAEWSKAAVLKTAVRQRTGGSNPSFSAK